MRKHKRDPNIEGTLDDQRGWDRENLIFSEGRTDHIDAAADRGWHTHLLTDPAGWAARLVSEGLLSQEDAA